MLDFFFYQSGKKEKRPYFELVYNLFKIYCTKYSKFHLKTWIDKKTNQEYSSISFATIQLYYFITIYSLWYNNGKKRVPFNIKESLTALGFGLIELWVMALDIT